MAFQVWLRFWSVCMVCLGIIGSSWCAAQPTHSWEQSYGGTMTEWLGSTVLSMDGGVIYGAWSASADGDVGGQGEIYDQWVLKTDREGQIVWSRILGGSDYEEGCYIAENADGSIWVVGETASFDGIAAGNHGKWDILVVKLNRDGEILFSNTYGGNGADDISGMVPTADGGLVFCCSSWSNAGTGDIGIKYGERDVWLVKLDAEGHMQWQKTIGGSKHDTGQIYAASDNGYWLAVNSRSSDGHFPELNGQSDFWILRLDSLGNILWKKRLGVADDLLSIKVALGHNGTLVTLQEKIGQQLNDLIRYDDQGTIVEEIKDFPLINDYQSFWIGMHYFDGQGYYFTVLDSLDRGFILHTSENYQLKWKHYFEGPGIRHIMELTPIGAEELLVTGMISAKPIRSFAPDEEIDIWAARLALPTSVLDHDFSNKRPSFSISNPIPIGADIHMSSVHTIESDVVISIFSLDGNLVQKNTVAPSLDSKNLTIPHSLPRGAYVMKIDNGGITESYVLIVQ